MRLIEKILKNSPSDTPSGAIVMACGIFINYAMKNIPLIDKKIGQVFTIALLLIWVFIISSFIKTILQGTIKAIHLESPIKSFAIGTWVAGTSVLGISVFQRLPEIAFLSQFLVFANTLLLLIYMGICIRNYKSIFIRQLYNNVHGVLLLPTVSIQSIVILGNTVFDGFFPILAGRILISSGVCFYAVAFILIIKRYFFSRSWSIEQDWQNTNCILHGAMSITGLASIVSKAVSFKLIFLIWIWALVWFIIVEAIELYRAWKRIKLYGVVGGVLVYNVTQWSRIFTFGMFYAFTMRLDLSSAFVYNGFILSLQENILSFGKWVMVCLLLIEGYLYVNYRHL